MYIWHIGNIWSKLEEERKKEEEEEEEEDRKVL